MYGAYGGQSSLWTLALIVAIVVLRVARSRGVHPVNPTMLVITTLLIVYATYALVAFYGAAAGATSGRPSPSLYVAALPWYALGAVLGLGLGIVRARMVRMYRDGTGRVTQQSSAATLLIWVALFAIRFVVRYLAAKGLVGPVAEPLTDALLLVGTGSIIGRNVILLARYWQLRSPTLPGARSIS